MHYSLVQQNGSPIEEYNIRNKNDHRRSSVGNKQQQFLLTTAVPFVPHTVRYQIGHIERESENSQVIKFLLVLKGCGG